MQASMDEIRRLVGLQLGRREVAPTDRLVEDLGAESADLVNVVATLEEKFAIHIAEEEIPGLRTVADILALVNQRLSEQ